MFQDPSLLLVFATFGDRSLDHATANHSVYLCFECLAPEWDSFFGCGIVKDNTFLMTDMGVRMPGW
jgi:hypothetical protein